MYGYFEKLLNDLCREQRDAKQLSLSLKDLSGKGIERAKNYLLKVVGVEKSFTTPEWQSIEAIGVLRNAIAHRDGFVDYEPNRQNSVYSKLTGICGVELRQETMNHEYAQIFFNEQFVIETLDLFDTFIRKISAEISNG